MLFLSFFFKVTNVVLVIISKKHNVVPLFSFKWRQCCSYHMFSEEANLVPVILFSKSANVVPVISFKRRKVCSCHFF